MQVQQPKAQIQLVCAEMFFFFHGGAVTLSPSATLRSAGETAGLRAIHRGARGAEWDEGPERARDPESEGAPEAGYGCSAGGAKAG